MFKIDEALTNGTNLWEYNKEKQAVEFAYADDIKAEYEKLFETIFPNINLDESSPQGQIITSLVQGDLNELNTLSNLANAFFFGGSGIFLDMWAFNLFRITRKQGIKSQVIIKIQGKVGTVVPNTFKISDGEHYFTIASATTIPSGGKVEALFVADKLEDFQAGANTINKISKVVVGVDRVNNPAKATKPVLRESDSDLYQRAVTFGALATNSTFQSIMANIAQINGVTKLSGGENFTSANLSIKDCKLKPHSIYIIVKGGTDKEIAEIIKNTRPPGCNMNGNVEVEILSDGEKYTYKFERPTIVNLKAEITISFSGLVEADYPNLTKTALENYINGLPIASLISQPSISQALRDQVKLFEIIDVKFGKKEIDGVGYEPLQLKLNEEALISPDDIVIKVKA